MIHHYSDHAANERTFLAWVRTAIAFMGFGFLIVKFDIFLATMAAGTSSSRPVLHGQKFANEAGLVFILLGVAMTMVAAVRFFRMLGKSTSQKRFQARVQYLTWPSPLLSFYSGFLCFFISRVRFCRGSDGNLWRHR